MKLSLSLISFSLLASQASSFLFFSHPECDPSLSQMIDAQTMTRLSINLEVGKEGDGSRFAIRNMVLDLYHDPPTNEHVGMPGKNGPHPKVSSGIRRLDVIDGGHFISQKGAEHIEATKSAWEVNWKKDLPAGALVCGFETPCEYNRNDAVLPKGRIYLSFPVWNEEGLAFAREQKAYVNKAAKEAQKERDEEIEKYRSTNNLLMKALHYRNAYAAQEKNWNQPVKRYDMVPEEDEVITLQDDLLLTTKGLLWSKTLPIGEQVLLGTATISLEPKE